MKFTIAQDSRSLWSCRGDTFQIMRIWPLLKGILGLVGAITVTFGNAFISTHSDDEKQIRQLYSKVENAMRAGNLSTYEETEAPGFTMVDDGHAFNAEQTKARVKQMFTMTMKIDMLKVKIKSIKISSDTAHVLSTYKSSFHLSDYKNPKALHVMTAAGKTDKELVKTPQGWRIQSEKDYDVKMTFDGKPFRVPD